MRLLILVLRACNTETTASEKSPMFNPTISITQESEPLLDKDQLSLSINTSVELGTDNQ
jgi:hypothetical protein